MPISSPPAFKPAVPPIALGTAGQVLTSNGPTAATPPTFKTPSGGGGTLPGRIAANLAAGVTNDYNPGGTFPTNIARLLLNPNAGNSELTGLVAGTDGQLVWLWNAAAIGGNLIQLDNLNAGSAAANRFSISNDPFILGPQSAVLLVYDGTLALWNVGP